jgi:hypothetical protein
MNTFQRMISSAFIDDFPPVPLKSQEWKQAPYLLKSGVRENPPRKQVQQPVSTLGTTAFTYSRFLIVCRIKAKAYIVFNISRSMQ